jgi:hypothetical protein
VLAQFDAAPSRSEYAAAVRRLKDGKAAGADGVVAELLKAGGDAFHDRLFELVAACWEGGEVPAAWRDAIIVTLPKKGDLRLCDSWRGISLLSVPGKPSPPAASAPGAESPTASRSCARSSTTLTRAPTGRSTLCSPTSGARSTASTATASG